MTLTIGRFVTDTFDQWSETIDGQVSVSGWSGDQDDQDAEVGEYLARLLVGHARDGSPVHVGWTERPGVDGLYRVVDASVRADETAPDLWAWSATLERVGRYLEIVADSRLRTNDHSLAAFSAMVAVPSSATTRVPDVEAPVDASGERTTEDGELSLWGVAEGVDRPKWLVPAADFYLGSPFAYVDAGRPLVGPQTLTDSDVSVTNGLVTVTPVVNGGEWRLSVTSRDDATTETHEIAVGGVAASTFGPLVEAGPARVVRSGGTSQAHVRWLGLTGVGGPVMVDVRLRRGDRFARVTLAATLADAQLAVNGVGATLSETTGIARETSGTHRLIVAQPLDFTVQGSTRVETDSAVPSATFAIGHILDAASASGSETESELTEQAYASVAESSGGVDL